MSKVSKKRRCPAKERDETLPDTDRNGNTESRSGPTGNRWRGWFFTENNPDTEFSTVERLTHAKCDYAVQLEVGEEEKTPHLQGVVYFESARSLAQMKSEFSKTAHWEKAKNKKACINYCQKEMTSTGRKWIRGMPRPVVDPLKGRDLRPWQRDVMDVISRDPDDRTIHWFWDREGACGKTILCKHLVITRKALVLSGKGTDIKFAIAQCVEKSLPIEIVIFNFARSTEEFVSYEAIEQVKDGLFFSGKYESAQVVFNCPHVICFANFPPNLDKLSMDRWNVKSVNNTNFELE